MQHTATTLPSLARNLLYACMLLIGISAINPTSAEGYWFSSNSANNGFTEWRASHVGPTTACPANTMELEFVLRDAETLGPLLNNTGLQVTMYYSGDGYPTTYTPWRVYDGSKTFICVPGLAVAAIHVWSSPGSTYFGGITPPTRASSTQSRLAEQGQHYTRTVYLSRRTDTTPNVVPAYPVNVVATSSSGMRTNINEIAPIGSANATYILTYQVRNLDDATSIFFSEVIPEVGLGTLAVGNPGYRDGFNEWMTYIHFNGVNGGVSGIPASIRRREYFPFVYDATPPNSTLTSTVEQQGETTQRISLTNNISDAVSGLAQTVIVIENRTTGARTNITQDFPLAMGNYYGTWRDPQVVSTAVQVSRDYAYALYAVTRDVGGNVRTTDPIIIPDRFGNTSGSVGTNLTIGLSATPSSIVLGSQSMLSWNIQNATGCTASWNPGFTFTNGVPGSAAVSPTATTNYILTCTNGTNTASRQATVSVAAVPPTLSISSADTLIRRGATTTLTWSVTPPTGITGCTMSGLEGSPIAVGTSGSVPTPSLMNQRVFTLSCTGPGGTYDANTTVRVLPETTER